MTAEELIAAERVRQDAKWGSQRQHPDGLWLAILVEEVGEAAQAILDKDEVSILKEATQVAAVAAQWIDSILAGVGR